MLGPAFPSEITGLQYGLTVRAYSTGLQYGLTVRALFSIIKNALWYEQFIDCTALWWLFVRRFFKA